MEPDACPFETGFKVLDHFLKQHQSLWKEKPFEAERLPWSESYPALCNWLDRQTLSELAVWKQSPRQLNDVVSEMVSGLDKVKDIIDLPRRRFTEEPKDLGRLSTGIPGRKWSQILAFDQSLEAGGSQWLEWCGGKGYLGRLLAVTRGADVTTLEWQESLCQAGQEYADKHSLPMKFVQGDAFSPKSGDHVLKCDHAVALHACGDLHVRLIQHAVNARTAAVSISPCCYHLINDEYYMPLSSIAKASHLKLDKDNLKLPLQESVTAGQSVRSKRFVEVSFRLGFDALLRDRLGFASYVPVPSIQKSLLGEGFERFCIWAAKNKGITLPEGIDYHGFLAHGEERFFLVEQMETVRTIFRRPLELWLVLDRVLFLKEQGYEVSLGEFCERKLTPRNVLIQGKLAQ